MDSGHTDTTELRSALIWHIINIQQQSLACAHWCQIPVCVNSGLCNPLEWTAPFQYLHVLNCFPNCSVFMLSKYTSRDHQLNIAANLQPTTNMHQVGVTIDNRPMEKGLETRNFFAISRSGARYGHVI